MKFSTDVNRLSEALTIVTRALSARTTNPILDGILMEAVSGRVQLTCSDERITIITRVEADVTEAGRGVIPGKLFFEMIRRMRDGVVSIDMNSSFQFKIRCLKSRMNLSGQNAEYFPLPAIVDGEKEITLPQILLKEMIEKTAFAIAPDDMREVLTGAYLDVENGTASMVALDGYRLAVKSSKIADIDTKFSAIIPGRAIGDIGRLLKDGEDDFCVLSFQKNKLHINLMGTDIYVVLIEGEYVDYKRLLPSKFNTRVIADIEALKGSVDRAALIAREGSSNYVRFSVSDNKMCVESKSEIGDSHEEIEVEQDGGDLSIAFNVKYIQDVMRTLTGEMVELSFNTPITPCIVTPNDDMNYKHLVLPVRTA